MVSDGQIVAASAPSVMPQYLRVRVRVVCLEHTVIRVGKNIKG